MTPSAARNPATRSKSWPGVRIVIVSGLPATRISSGSSTASVSGRRPRAPVVLTRSTGLRTVIRPMP